jgi:hypothetical protein
VSDKSIVRVVIIKGEGNTVTGRKGLQYEKGEGQHHCYKGISLPKLGLSLLGLASFKIGGE